MTIRGRSGPRPVENGHVADPMHERAAGAPSQLLEERITCLPITPGSLDLDQLVIGECAVGFAGDSIGQSGVAQPHDRLQLVGEAAQMSALALGERFL